MNVRWLSHSEVIALHTAIMRRMNLSLSTLRGEGALESAVTRPRMASQYENADLVRQSVMLAVGISQAQGFVDGNKRTAYAALELFLFVNGTVIDADPTDVARHIVTIAETSDRQTATLDFESWLRGVVFLRD